MSIIHNTVNMEQPSKTTLKRLLVDFSYLSAILAEKVREADGGGEERKKKQSGRNQTNSGGFGSRKRRKLRRARAATEMTPLLSST